MTASTHRKGACPPDHDVASVTLDNHNPNTSPKRYHYWVPKRWNTQPGDKLRVFVSERKELKLVTVRDMHFACEFDGAEHKLALGLHRRAEPKVTGKKPEIIVMDDWPTDPPSRITFVGADAMLADMKVLTDPRPGFDQMAYYRQAFRDRMNTPPERAKTLTPKDTAMEIQNQTLVNGRNIKDMTDDQLFDLIAAEEAKIKALRAIENKPQKLKDRINKMQADIETLIKLIDER